MTIGQTRTACTGLVLFGLACLSASGLAGAHGALELDDVPEGIVQASITDRPNIQGLNAMILSAPRPGIMLRYNGEQPLTVLGVQDEAFLLFTRNNVSVNTRSPSWDAVKDTATYTTVTSTENDLSDQPTWVTLSESGNFSWLDPRLNVMADVHHDVDTPKEWSIKLMRADGEIKQISGNLTFKPFE